MKNRCSIKPVLAISSLPVWGRVGLAITIPILERQGIQVCTLPTALVSTHCGYPQFVLQSQTPFLEQTLAHLESLSIFFSVIYISFVHEESQFLLLENFLKQKKINHPFTLVDPILADNGQLYRCFDHQNVALMRSLASHADLITPNITEAALLLGLDPREHPQNKQDLHHWLKALANIGPGQGPRFVVLTSFSNNQKNHLGVAAYDKITQEVRLFCYPRSKNYPGTGDYLASEILVGWLKSNRPESERFFYAARRSANRVAKIIHHASQDDQDPLQGLPWLF